MTSSEHTEKQPQEPSSEQTTARTGSLTYQVGDATNPTAPGPTMIVHVCNDVGGWGRGFVVALSGRFPEPEAAYRGWFRGEGPMLGEERTRNDPELGAVQFIPVGPVEGRDLVVANMIGQRNVISKDGVPPVRYEAIAEALKAVADKALAEGRSVAMPKIGAGLAGGEWEKIERIVEKTLVEAGVDVTVYTLS